MITKFTTGNFLSFKDKTSISFAAKKNLKDHPESIFKNQNQTYLKTISIYGANAAGKSNLIKALKFFKHFLTEFRPLNEGDIKIPMVSEFLLSTQTEDKPSFFEIEVIINDEIYIYGFEVSKKEIHKEWLWRKKNKKKFFDRDKQLITPARDFKKEATKESIAHTREDTLFLTRLAELNVELARLIKAEVLKINILSGITEEMRRFAISSYTDNPDYKKIMDEFITKADLGIKEIKAKYNYLQVDELFKDSSEDVKKIVEKVKELTKLIKKQSKKPSEDSAFSHQIFSVHEKFDKDGKKIAEVQFDFRKKESDGTHRMFFLSAQFAKIFLEGGLVIIDEFNTALHPTLCKFILNKFNSNEINSRNSQLVFTTHDISLLDDKYLRKDQILFIEKNRFGSSELFSLADLGEREGVSYSKRYLEGRYGAIPYIKHFE